MAVTEIHATVSHRYYMRKTKAEIVQRIRDILRDIPISMIERDGSYLVFEGPRDKHRCLWLLATHKDSPRELAVWTHLYMKDTLASAAMLAHELLGRHLNKIEKPS